MTAVATKDWKAELQRRIADIKEKKKAESSVKDKARNYLEKQRRAVEFEKALEEKSGKFEPAAEVADFTSRKQEEVQAEPIEAVEEKAPEKHESKKTKPREDTLFEIEEDSHKSDSRDTDTREARIRAALKKFSNSPVEEKVEIEQPPIQAKEIEDSVEIATTPRVTATDDALSALRSAQVRIEDSLESALDTKIPSYEPDEMDQDGDVLHHSMMMEDDEQEYIQPQRSTPETAIDHSGRYVMTLRSAAMLIDLAIVSAVTAGFVFISSMLLNTGFFDVLGAASLPVIGLVAVVHLLYYVTFTSSSGQTPGKSLMHIKVKSPDTGTLGIPGAAARWLLNIIGLVIGGIGLLMAFVNTRGRTLSDITLRQRVTQI